MIQVFVPHCPTRYDPLDQRRVPTVDLAPAAAFGKLRRLTNESISLHDQHGMDIAIGQVLLALEESDISADDFILAVGDPVLIGVSIAKALELTDGKVNVLRWDRTNRAYIKFEVEI